jgi:uncharacterized protein YndB with AHSA1/START domain
MANSRGDTVAQPANSAGEKNGFFLERLFNASREDVWNAFTQPEHLTHWWGPPGSSIEIARYELKAGGLFHYCMKLADNRLMWARFIFREIVEPERLAWLNGFSDKEGGLTRNPWVPGFPLETLNTVTFAARESKTLLTITVAPFNASDGETRIFEAGVNGMKVGFGSCFNKLADYLERQDNLRP